MIIKIADLPVCWPEEHRQFVAEFASEAATEAAPQFTLSVTSGLRQCHGIQFAERTDAHFLYRQTLSPEVLFANSDWSEATVYCDGYADENYTLPLAALYSRLVQFQTLLVHGSLVEWAGQGMVFTGYSGVGKTTQARLWQQYLNADIINGDKLLLRLAEQQPTAYGIPWKGSSPYCLNRKVPLKAIVVLRQAEQNSIRKLDSAACMEYFMPHVFLPHWDTACMAQALDSFDKLLEKTSVWLLQCRPDEAAVLLTKEQIYG